MRLDGHVLVDGGSTNDINGNGNVLFLLGKGAEQQECRNGGAKGKMGWY